MFGVKFIKKVDGKKALPLEKNEAEIFCWGERCSDCIGVIQTTGNAKPCEIWGSFILVLISVRWIQVYYAEHFFIPGVLLSDSTAKGGSDGWFQKRRNA